jgi:hypothetical protein
LIIYQVLGGMLQVAVKRSEVRILKVYCYLPPPDARAQLQSNDPRSGY